MINQVINKEQLNTCLDIIHRSFVTVAEEFGLTESNCPSHTAFMTIDKLAKIFDEGRPMFIFYQEDMPVGYFSLENCGDEKWELNNLAVLPKYRHLGIGKAMIEYAVDFVIKLNGKIITIGIIEENTVLKKWYTRLGFIHTGVRNFSHLPFTVGFMELECKSFKDNPQNKFENFLENARLLNEKFDTIPLLYGSLGLEVLTDTPLNADDIDILIPKLFVSGDRWLEFKSLLEINGYILIDEHEHTFCKDGVDYSYADIEGLKDFADIDVQNIEIKNITDTRFMLLSLEQYLRVYQKSSQDGYRVNVKEKQDNQKIDFIKRKMQ